MTDTTDKYRALFLSALMVLSVMVGTVAFAGTAAAVDASATLDADAYENGDTITVSIDDSDLNSNTGAAETYVVDITSTTEGTTSVSGEAVAAGGTTSYTTAQPVATGADNLITAGDFTYSNGDADGTTISSVSRNADGTVTLTLSNTETSGDGDTIAYTAGETVSVTETGADTGVFTGTTTVSTTDSAGVLQAAGGDTITLTYDDASEGDDATDTARFDAVAGGPSVVKAVEYNDVSEADGHEIELAFDQSVYQNVSGFNAPTASNVTVYVDGAVVTPESVTAESPVDTNGRLDIELPNDVTPNQDLVVKLNTLKDDAGNPVTFGNVSVTVTGDTVVALASGVTNPGTTSDITVYQGTVVAVDWTAGTTDEQFERYADTRRQFQGRVGTNSNVLVFNSDGANVSATHNWRDGTFTNSERVSEVHLDQLGLTATAVDTSITTADPLEVDVTSNAGGRQLEATLYDSNDNEVASQLVTTDSATGDVTVSFNLASDDTGTYYVEVQDVLSGVSQTTADITVDEAAEGEASFALNTYTTFSGGVAEIELDLSATDTATLTVGSAGAGYLVNVTVEDGDNDGDVTLLWNTYLAGGSSSEPNFNDDFSVKDSDDSITTIDGSTHVPTSPVDTGTYNLDVRAGTSVSATAQGVSVVAVEERFSSNLTSWTIPEERLPTKVSDLQNASANGNLTADERIASGDWLVLAWETNGVEGVLSAQDSNGFSTANSTTQFLDAASTSGDSARNLNFTLVQTNPQQNRVPKTLSVDQTSLQVLPDHANGTVYLLVDTGDISSSRPIKSGDKFRANLTVEEQAGWQASNDSVTDDFEIVNATIDFDRDPVQVLAEGGQTIRGTSNVAPGTTVRLQLQSVNASPRFIKSTSVRVTADNTWSASFDFSGQAVGDTFDATVSDSSRSLSDTADGEVVSELEATPGGVRTVIVPSPTPAFVPVTRVVTQEVTRTVVNERTVTVTVTQTPGQPGFGIAVAIVALLAAALLALRRRD